MLESYTPLTSPRFGEVTVLTVRTAMAVVGAELGQVKALCDDLREALVGEGPKRGRGELTMLRLKGASRGVHQHIEACKGKTDDERSSYDSNSLQLHNLLYEKNHYNREIAKCKDFRSKHMDIDLVPEDVFLEAAPPDLRRMGEAVEPHQRMLDRLEFELVERRRLAEEERVLASEKASLHAQKSSKTKFLRSLPGHLRNMQKASLPLQKAMGYEYTATMTQHEVARSLPAPLYVIYAHLEAFRKTRAQTGSGGGGVVATVEINGEVADAEGWYRRRDEAAAQGDGEGAAGAATEAEGASAKEEKEDEEEHRSSKRAKTDTNGDVKSNKNNGGIDGDGGGEGSAGATSAQDGADGTAQEQGAGAEEGMRRKAEDEREVVSRSASGSRRKSRTPSIGSVGPPASQMSVVSEEEADIHSALYAALDNNTMPNAVQEWLDRYEANQDDAILELINLVLEASCPLISSAPNSWPAFP